MFERFKIARLWNEKKEGRLLAGNLRANKIIEFILARPPAEREDLTAHAFSLIRNNPADIIFMPAFTRAFEDSGEAVVDRAVVAPVFTFAGELIQARTPNVDMIEPLRALFADSRFPVQSRDWYVRRYFKMLERQSDAGLCPPSRTAVAMKAAIENLTPAGTNSMREILVLKALRFNAKTAEQGRAGAAEFARRAERLSGLLPADQVLTGEDDKTQAQLIAGFANRFTSLARGNDDLRQMARLVNTFAVAAGAGFKGYETMNVAFSAPFEPARGIMAVFKRGAAIHLLEGPHVIWGGDAGTPDTIRDVVCQIAYTDPESPVRAQYLEFLKPHLQA